MEEKTKIITVLLEDGKEIKIEATAFEELGSEERVAAIGLPNFSKISETIEIFANTISKTIEKVEPTKATIEFGFNIGADNSNNISAILVKGNASANLKISLEWQKK